MNNPKPSQYWDSTLIDDAIIRYNNARSLKARNEIYSKHLEKPFQTLCEVYVSRYLFDQIEREHNIHDCLCYIQKILKNYTKEKGKSFGYISICIRNYVWHKYKKESAYADKHTSIDQELEDGSLIIDVIPAYEQSHSLLDDHQIDTIRQLLTNHWTLDQIRSVLKNNNYSENKIESVSNLIHTLLQKHFLNKDNGSKRNFPNRLQLQHLQLLTEPSKQLLERNGINI